MSDRAAEIAEAFGEVGRAMEQYAETVSAKMVALGAAFAPTHEPE